MAALRLPAVLEMFHFLGIVTWISKRLFHYCYCSRDIEKEDFQFIHLLRYNRWWELFEPNIYIFLNILEWAYLPLKSFWVYYHHLYESDRTPTEEFLLGLQKCWDYLMVKKNKIELFVHISIGKIKFFFSWHCAIGGIIIVSRRWINLIFPFVW